MSSFGVEDVLWNKIYKLYVIGKMALQNVETQLPGVVNVSLHGKRCFISAIRIMDVDNPGRLYETENSGWSQRLAVE